MGDLNAGRYIPHAEESSVSAVETVSDIGTVSPMASYGSKTPLFGKIICGDCGALMKRKTYKDAKKGANGGNYKVWVCKTPKRAKAESLDIHSDYDDYDEERVYCSTKSVRETDIINEILRQAGQQPEAQRSALTAEGTGTAVETARQPQVMAESDENGKLPRAVEQLLPRIKRIIIGGHGGQGEQDRIHIEWN